MNKCHIECIYVDLLPRSVLDFVGFYCASCAKSISRDAKTLQTYKPGLEEGFGQKLRKVLLPKIKFYLVSMVLISVENKSSINT